MTGLAARGEEVGCHLHVRRGAESPVVQEPQGEAALPRPGRAIRVQEIAGLPRHIGREDIAFDEDHDGVRASLRFAENAALLVELPGLARRCVHAETLLVHVPEIRAGLGLVPTTRPVEVREGLLVVGLDLLSDHQHPAQVRTRGHVTVRAGDLQLAGPDRGLGRVQLLLRLVVPPLASCAGDAEAAEHEHGSSRRGTGHPIRC